MVDQEQKKTKIVKLSLSQESIRMVEEMGAVMYPDRPRVQSQTVDRAIREMYERFEREREATGR